ncbi:hypothetical protein GOQ04_24720 [Emticicia sp. ODNR4P]|jgi:hypothetical protein|nr:hypothetical protein [Emticicia sp. ODNR4P]
MGASTIVNSASIAQLMGWTKEYSAKKIREVKKATGCAYVTFADCAKAWKVSMS